MADDRRGTKLRCAVYTRKSTEDGLEQEYNSLDAQFDACSAYILSQRHEGWTLAPDRYDDGGFSGGNMERPGLKRLLADVAAGKVDVIVLYKIDRLTRSLADFAKIVEILDAAGASFVSVTQAFNTTTSMGRLMLNVLLSFAQFEREVTGERIRDKIAASKKKGLWMGGPVPLGYVVQDRKLVVHEEEAETVCHIMRRYLDLGSVRELVEELDRDGYRTKVQRQTSGPHRGGCVFRRGTLYHLLSNRIYLGEIVHKGVAYPGDHDAIVPVELWQQVQDKITAGANGGARRLRAQHPSLLIGLLHDGADRPMSPSHTNKGSQRYRYYITRGDALDGERVWRVSAHDIEALVCRRLAEFLKDSSGLSAMLVSEHDASTLHRSLSKADIAAANLLGPSFSEKGRLIDTLVRRITLQQDRIEIELDRNGLAAQLATSLADGEAILISTEAVRVRRGHQIRLIIPAPATATMQERRRDPKLLALMGEAIAARELLLASGTKSLLQIATEAGRCRKRLGRLLAISCLAPDIVTALVEGRQPSSLTAKSLLATDLPLGWNDQRSQLGIA